MKRLITVLIGILIAGVLSAQTSNTFKYVLKTQGGIINTKKGLAADKVDSTKVSGGNFTTYKGADTINPTISASGKIDASTLYVKLLPDTVQITDLYTLTLTDANKIIVGIKASSIAITIPDNATAAIPLGTTINFVQGGAGILVFKKAVGVVMTSKKDSVATGGIWSWAALFKRGTNNWVLYGDITD
jgi:hypothetical protein